MTNGSEPLPGIRTVTMTINDGIFNATLTIRISVTVINNNQPVLSFDGEPLIQYDEGSGIINIGSEMLPVVYDADNNDVLLMTNATVQLLNAIDGGEEQLAIDIAAVPDTITVEGKYISRY